MCRLKSSALALACVVLAPLFAQPTFKMIDLGALPGNYYSSWAVGINELGEVVGFSGGGPSAFLFWFGHGFLWKNGVMTDLGALTCPPQLFACLGSAAWGINDRGQVVGYSGGATSPFRALEIGEESYHAVLWENGVITDLGDPAHLNTPTGSGAFAVQLRAYRNGAGTGRVYTLKAAATDRAGNAATVLATCSVPHDPVQ